MILTEEHRIKYNKDKDMFRTIDRYCYSAKNLSNSVNYLIKQCSRIHRKLAYGDILDSWEKALIHQINSALYRYNKNRAENKKLKFIDENNGYIADAYFLSFLMKTWDVYKDMPYSTCSQICIQEKCREWKAYYKSLAAYKKTPSKFLGFPKVPGYLDHLKGRGRIVITSQNFSVSEDGTVKMPGFLKGIHIIARRRPVRQIRIITKSDHISIQLMYEHSEDNDLHATGVMGIDLGVDNLMAISFDTGTAPVIINGRPLKSINQYYNKKRGALQETANKSNGRYNTKAIDRLTSKRNQKIKDYMHKASRKVIELARDAGVGTIIIGNNTGWKQKISMGKRTNQTFVSIPYHILIDMITYKAAMVGIKVNAVRESYTSGTSYLDGEYPDKVSYDNTRRIKRGLFRSNDGTLINADVNAAYQIIKTTGRNDIRIKRKEQILKLNVA